MLVNYLKKLSWGGKYLHNALQLLKNLPFPYNMLKCYYAVDMYLSARRYGTNMEDYISLWFWKVPSAEKCKYLTTGNIFTDKFLNTFYKKEDFDIIMSKKVFNQKFSKFIYRDWIYTGDCSIDEIRTFISRLGKVIVKPLADSCGRGIEIIDNSRIDWLIREKEEGRDFIIEEILVNHPIIKALMPTSLQTLRVETCIDSHGDFHLLNCCLMIGAQNSIVSNCHGGGHYVACEFADGYCR